MEFFAFRDIRNLENPDKRTFNRIQKFIRRLTIKLNYGSAGKEKKDKSIRELVLEGKEDFCPFKLITHVV